MQTRGSSKKRRELKITVPKEIKLQLMSTENQLLMLSLKFVWAVEECFHLVTYPEPAGKNL